MQLYTSQLHTQIILCGNFDIWFHYSCTRNQEDVGKKDMRSLNCRFTGANPQIDFAEKSGEICQLGMSARNGVGWNHRNSFFLRKTILREQDELRNIGWILESDWDSLRDFWRAQTQHYLVQRRGASGSDPCSTLFCTGEQFFIYQVNISLNFVLNFWNLWTIT